MLRGAAKEADPRVLVGVAEGDDAGVVSFAPGLGLLHTIDVITPIVDDPRAFGRIAAANAVSDVYAMGGEPLSAVALLGVPKELPRVAVPSMLRGAGEVLRKAGCALVGGHTVKDKELKLGFAVTGTVDLRRMTTVSAAEPGDQLVLTKPLGTGVLYQAMKLGVRRPAEEKAAIASMAALNREAKEAMVAARAKAATDVTGFGLAGHALNIARHSKVEIALFADRLPVLPGVLEHLRNEVYPGATDTNLAGYGEGFSPDGMPLLAVRLVAQPETSGGLLIALPARRASRLAEALGAAVVGEVRARRRAGIVRLVARSARG
jgi:selenide,water dikinase